MSYDRSREDQRRLARLYRETYRSMRGGAYYDRDKRRICRYTWNRGNGLTRYLRRRGNRAVRKAGQALRGGEYRRFFPYWWELF